MLTGCAQPNGGSGSSTAAGSRDTSPDPYHYRCTGNCQAG
jgi:hypothetical protein